MESRAWRRFSSVKGSPAHIIMRITFPSTIFQFFLLREFDDPDPAFEFIAFDFSKAAFCPTSRDFSGPTTFSCLRSAGEESGGNGHIFPTSGTGEKDSIPIPKENSFIIEEFTADDKVMPVVGSLHDKHGITITLMPFMSNLFL